MRTSLLSNRFDDDRAKRVAAMAFVAAYRPSGDPILACFESNDQCFLYMAFHEGLGISWWAVDRLAFTATKIAPPTGWPSSSYPLTSDC
jgi:hypothetical protein